MSVYDGKVNRSVSPFGNQDWAGGGVRLFQLNPNSNNDGNGGAGGVGGGGGNELGIGAQMMANAQLNPQYEADKAATSVQEKFDVAQAGNNRRLSAMGIDPSSGRSRAMNRNSAVALAAAKAGAANKGRRAALLDNWSRMSSAAGMIQKDQAREDANDRFNVQHADANQQDVFRVGPNISQVRGDAQSRKMSNTSLNNFLYPSQKKKTTSGGTKKTTSGGSVSSGSTFNMGGGGTKKKNKTSSSVSKDYKGGSIKVNGKYRTGDSFRNPGMGSYGTGETKKNVYIDRQSGRLVHS